MHAVDQDAVVRHWLEMERRKAGTPDFDVDAPSEREALDRLLELKPGAAAFVWRDAPVAWHHVTLAEGAFMDLHVIDGPEGMGWRALSPDGTIRGAAERIASDDPGRLADATGVDVRAVLDLAAEMPGAGEEEFVLSTRRGCVPVRVADGNHRAVAKALSVLDGGRFVPQPAYLGVGANPVLSPLVERTCGLLRALRPGRGERPP